MPLQDDATGKRRHDDDAVGQDQPFPDAVGDEDDRLSPRRPDAQEFVLHLVAGQFVQGAERLVHQKDFRIERECAGDGDALLHAAGEFKRVLVFRARQADQREKLTGQKRRILAPHATVDGSKGDIALGRQPGEQRILLKYDTLAAARPGYHRPGNTNFS